MRIELWRAAGQVQQPKLRVLGQELQNTIRPATIHRLGAIRPGLDVAMIASEVASLGQIHLQRADGTSSWGGKPKRLQRRPKVRCGLETVGRCGRFLQDPCPRSNVTAFYVSTGPLVTLRGISGSSGRNSVLGNEIIGDAVAQQRKQVRSDDLIVLVVVRAQIRLEIARPELRSLER